MRLKGKVALITGAGSGIGRATAILFANEGAKVAVADLVTPKGEETVHRIIESNGEAIFVRADVSKSYDAKKMINTVLENYGKIDIVFNKGIFEGQKISRAFCHFFAPLDDEKGTVHPEIEKRFAGGRF